MGLKKHKKHQNIFTSLFINKKSAVYVTIFYIVISQMVCFTHQLFESVKQEWLLTSAESEWTRMEMILMWSYLIAWRHTQVLKF